jgi:hypothetical protein
MTILAGFDAAPDNYAALIGIDVPGGGAYQIVHSVVALVQTAAASTGWIVPSDHQSAGKSKYRPCGKSLTEDDIRINL